MDWNFFGQLDKIAHMAVYFLLALSLGWSSSRRSGLNGAKIGWITLVCIVYGILMEWMQYSFLSDRFFEIHDIIANIIGSVVGAVFIFLIFIKMKRI